jgi:phosphate starvation-inducible PhoH-like protein
MVTKKIFLKSSDEVVRLLGRQDENLRKLEEDYGVQIFVKQGASTGEFSVVVRGPSGKTEKALAELDSMRRRNDEPQEISRASDIKAAGPGLETVYVTFQGRHIKPRSEHQKKYVELVRKNDMVFAIGPAGTGKTFLAVACALEALNAGKINRIVLTRPVVEAGEKLGFLPGDLYEKINPYLKPLYDAFYAMLGVERFRFLKEEETIEIIPLAYMRGRTIDDAFIILDEAQNTTPPQMKMFLTRMGSGSKMIITGDVTQTDLDPKQQSGLVVAERSLADIEGIKQVHFGEEDVVRHNLVKKIISAYKE